MKNLGIVLIALGLLMMIYTGFNYVSEKRVVDIGPLKIDKAENHPVHWSPVVGGVLLVVGIALVATNRKKVS